MSTVSQARFILAHVSFLSPRPPSPRSHAAEACVVSSGVLTLAPGAASIFSASDVLMSSSFSAVSFGVASVPDQFASSAGSVEFSPFAAPSSATFFSLPSAICCIAHAARRCNSTAVTKNGSIFVSDALIAVTALLSLLLVQATLLALLCPKACLRSNVSLLQYGFWTWKMECNKWSRLA